MKIMIVGAGPAGLTFAALMKSADPSHQITVLERNRLDDTFGFGVVLSDATQYGIADAAPGIHQDILERSVHWDDIDIHYRGERLRSTGHGFSGLARATLLEILTEHCQALGVEVRFQQEVDDPAKLATACDLLVGADGLTSVVRERWKDAFAPTIDLRPNRFVWLGTTRPFEAFTFDFRRDAHGGLWRLHAYQYAPGHSTFILEATEATWQAAGLAIDDEDATIAFAEGLFADLLGGHRLLKNRSLWRQFPTVRCARWHHENVVLMGDAVHTAHFSVGSGTKLAMEDAIALAAVLGRGGSLAEYEAERRPTVESLQRAAQASLEWFEGVERYYDRLDPIQFAFTLLTRSLRISHENLRVRDPEFVDRVNAFIASARPRTNASTSVPPPMFTPFRLRDLELPNRVVVSAMCQYSATDGLINDWHLVHLGSRAMGGAGLVMTEMTDVSADGRISTGCAGIYTRGHVDAWTRVAHFVHQYSDAKIGMQLGHAGRKGATEVLWEGGERAPIPDPWPLVAPSPVPYTPRNPEPREMTRADMDQVRDDFVQATRWADEAGFDLIEIHFAHGYLLGTFISPLTNRRTDAYGGDLAGRMRYPLEVFDACRAVWPAGKPMTVRISAEDWYPGGTTPDDAVAIAALLKAHGCDAVDVSSGQTVADQRPRYGRQYQTPFADRIRHEVGIPTMAVGAISSWEDVNTIIAAGRADLCLLARAHLWDPYWTRHAAQAQGWPMAWPPQYESLKGFTPR
ncbi:MAG: bifunctional salicylyl-CoA 5-hydroxylase/oxidoreductase [Gemmatimonadales bacterium]